MDAKDLYELTVPLFHKHPSACPKRFFFFFDNPGLQNEECFCVEKIDSDWAALIIQGHLVEWLIGSQLVANNRKRNLSIDVSEHSTEACRYCVDGNFGPTLLEALVVACMEVEK